MRTFGKLNHEAAAAQSFLRAGPGRAGDGPKKPRLSPCDSTKRPLSRPLATLSSIADGGEGRGEEVVSFIESAGSSIRGSWGFPEKFAY